jgi:UDPglucose--hexose-1-phosphate uridylyltransferase
MREVRTDPTTGDEVIISTERVARPHHLRAAASEESTGVECPFCPGAEHLTPAALAEVRRDGRWVVRAFPNRYPALGIEGDLERRAHGPYERVSGIGAHEVIVECREHAQPSWAVEQASGETLFLARSRLRDLARDARFRQLMWFRNVGSGAGASLAHPHSQIVATPVIPSLHRRMVDRCRRHFEATERELFDDLLDYDHESGVRWLAADHGVVALCPWAPRTAFEVWIVPRTRAASFLDANDETVAAVARLMNRVLAAMSEALESPPYNVSLFTAPLRGAAVAGFRWHLRIMPRLAQLAGFELGSGAVMHGVPPEHSARVLGATRAFAG